MTVDDWSYIEGNNPYDKAKTLSEKAAWDFQKEMSEESRFELVVINPGFVVGPNISTCQSFSLDFMMKLLTG